jgi:CRP-like cAMP-binding protein
MSHSHYKVSCPVVYLILRRWAQFRICPASEGLKMNTINTLPERLAASVISSCTYADFAKNEVISSSGTLPFGMTAIRHGLVGAFVPTDGEETLVAPLTPGSVLEGRVNRSTPNAFTYRALSSTRLLRLSEEKFQEFLQNPEFLQWCCETQHRNHAALSKISAAAAQKSTTRKILVFVTGYLENYFNRPLGDVETAEWLMTQSHMSDILGITRTHLNARLSALSKAGILEIRRRQVVWRRTADPENA